MEYLFAQKQVDLIYLSGHFAEKLFNNEEPTNFKISFLGKNQQVTVSAKGPDYHLSTKTLAGQCKVIIVVGCSVLGNKKHASNLQECFRAEGGGKPMILGFHKTCPAKGQDLLVQHFMKLLPKKNLTESSLGEAWLAAASAWKKEMPGFWRNVAFMTSGGEIKTAK